MRRNCVGTVLALTALLVSLGTYSIRNWNRDERAGGKDVTDVRMEHRDLLPGPYDPVLTQPVREGRAIPPPNRRVNDNTGEDADVIQSETTIAIHGDTVVVGWNDGYAFVNESHTGSGYGYSVDRGDTWTDGEGVAWGSAARPFGDPSVAVTNDGDWIFTSLDLGDGPLGITVNRGRFSGASLTWDPAEKYLDGPYIDKEYVEYDAATDRFYMTYQIPSTGRLTWSDDAGVTWAAPVTVATGTNPNGFYPAPGIDGEVYVSWVDPLGQDNSSAYVRYSSDGGQSWIRPPVRVAQLGPDVGGPPQCFNRSTNPNNPSMAIDRSHGDYRGRAYYAWSDGGPGDLNCYLSHSTDKGLTWMPPVQLNDNENVSEQFWPQVSVGPSGRASVAWLDRRNAFDNNSLCDCYVSQSVDGGVTWGPNRRISDISVAWCGVPANAAPNFGDYNELASDDRSLFVVWSDAREGGPDVLFARYDDRHLMTVTGELSEGRWPMSGDGVCWFIPNEAEFTVDPPPPIDSQAQLTVASLAMATLASEPEGEGLFLLAGEELSASVSLVSAEGSVTGSFSVARSEPSRIEIDFDAVSSTGLGDLVFLSDWATEAILSAAGPGVVHIAGSVTMEVTGGPLVFTLAGTIQLDGAPGGVLLDAQEVLQQASAQVSDVLTLHTRTEVERAAGAWVDADSPDRATNPAPLATIRATPNPLQPSTNIRWTLTHPVIGSIGIYSTDGRLVRTLIAGRFAAGSHDIPFDGRDNAGRRLAAGGYFVKLTSDRLHAGGKLILL